MFLIKTFSQYKTKFTFIIQINDCYKNYQGETLHLKFCKYILGLNNKSVNHASLSELGRHPLHYDIVKSLLKYCYRLENRVSFIEGCLFEC
jgi:hypothetical protein